MRERKRNKRERERERERERDEERMNYRLKDVNMTKVEVPKTKQITH